MKKNIRFSYRHLYVLLLATTMCIANADTKEAFISEETSLPTEQQAYFGHPGQTRKIVQRICSNRWQKTLPYFRQNIDAPNSTIALVVNRAECTSNKNEIENLLLQNTVSITDIKRICPDLVVNGPNTMMVKINGRGIGSGSPELLRINWNFNQNGVEECKDKKCSINVSPLVIHIASNPSRPKAVNLTSQANGVRFDITGNGKPTQISWFSNHDYRLLVLPGPNGRVLNIHQLFGDYTVGPDGKIASNGYAALAKYDGKSADGLREVGIADKKIDRNDPVFSRLRLWHDSNFDGIAQENELETLSQNKITFISLAYESPEEFTRIDKFGNKTTLKSKVGYENGNEDLMFDLYFNSVVP